MCNSRRALDAVKPSKSGLQKYSLEKQAHGTSGFYKGVESVMMGL